jgi:hypothetical protein
VKLFTPDAGATWLLTEIDPHDQDRGFGLCDPRVVSIEDLRPMARRQVPKGVFDYLDGGAEGEVTLQENCRAFEDVTFRPRHAVAIPHCDLRTPRVGFGSVPPVLAGARGLQPPHASRGRSRRGAQPVPQARLIFC